MCVQLEIFIESGKKCKQKDLDLLGNIIGQLCNQLQIPTPIYTPIDCGYQFCLDIDEIAIHLWELIWEISVELTFTILIFLCLHIFYKSIPSRS